MIGDVAIAGAVTADAVTLGVATVGVATVGAATAPVLVRAGSPVAAEGGWGGR